MTGADEVSRLPTTQAGQRPTDLHCQRRKHGVLLSGAVEIHCRWCSSVAGEPVVHRWDAATGVRLADDGAAPKTA